MDIFSVFPNIYKSVGILNILVLLIHSESMSILILITETEAYLKRGRGERREEMCVEKQK